MHLLNLYERFVRVDLGVVSEGKPCFFGEPGPMVSSG